MPEKKNAKALVISDKDKTETQLLNKKRFCCKIKNTRHQHQSTYLSKISQHLKA